MARTARPKPHTTLPLSQDNLVNAGVDVEDPLDVEETKTALLPAYRTYLEGRKGLAQAFRDREQRDQEAYKDAERRYHICEQSIDRAIRAREGAEYAASEEYKEDLDRAIERASQAYKEKTRQVLADCKQKVVEAWRSSTESSGDMNGVSEEEIEKAMQARQKAEVEALLSYRQEVDKALDKASQVYKERVKQALAECKKSVMAAWKTSMETSARMAGVFEGDNSTATDESANALSDRNTRVREWGNEIRRGFLSAVRSAKKALASGHSN